MHAAMTRQETKAPAGEGVVYRTTCHNPGCGYQFDLRITPKNAGLLSGTIQCPRCHRSGGMLKSMGRIAPRLYAAKLLFRLANVAGTRPEDDDLFGDNAR